MTDSARELAVLFHDTYERLAPQFGYETRKETRQFDHDTPNGKLMIAVCAEIRAHLSAPAVPAPAPEGMPVEPSIVKHWRELAGQGNGDGYVGLNNYRRGALVYIDALASRLAGAMEELERDRCRHGWRGSVPGSVWHIDGLFVWDLYR